MSNSTKHVQEAVAVLVAERGYREGYTPLGFLVRQLLKAAEELGEVFSAADRHLSLPLSVVLRAGALATEARQRFDEGWGGDLTTLADYTRNGLQAANVLQNMADELADLQVVLYCAAEALAEEARALRKRLSGEGVTRGVAVRTLERLEKFDIADAALEKSRRDVERGVR